MTEPNCVCGCTRHEHLELHEKSHYPEFRSVETWQACNKHNCMCFRPALPWPDAPGNWWCEGIDLVLAAYETDGEIYLDYPLKDIEPPDHGIWVGEYEFQIHYPKARFTRLLEPNPFDRL